MISCCADHCPLRSFKVDHDSKSLDGSVWKAEPPHSIRIISAVGTIATLICANVRNVLTIRHELPIVSVGAGEGSDGGQEDKRTRGQTGGIASVEAMDGMQSDAVHVTSGFVLVLCLSDGLRLTKLRV